MLAVPTEAAGKFFKNLVLILQKNWPFKKKIKNPKIKDTLGLKRQNFKKYISIFKDWSSKKGQFKKKRQITPPFYHPENNFKIF